MRNTLELCSVCGRVTDDAAKRAPDGLLCRFCQAEREGRCWFCGAPGEPWPFPDSRFTLTVVPTCAEHSNIYSAPQ